VNVPAQWALIRERTQPTRPWSGLPVSVQPTPERWDYYNTCGDRTANGGGPRASRRRTAPTSNLARPDLGHAPTTSLSPASTMPWIDTLGLRAQYPGDTQMLGTLKRSAKSRTAGQFRITDARRHLEHHLHVGVGRESRSVTIGAAPSTTRKFNGLPVDGTIEPVSSAGAVGGHVSGYSSLAAGSGQASGQRLGPVQ